MHPKIEMLLGSFVEDDICDEYTVWVPKQGRLVTAYTAPDGMSWSPNIIEQIETHGDETIVILKDHHDIPLNDSDFDNTIFQIYSTKPITIG